MNNLHKGGSTTRIEIPEPHDFRDIVRDVVYYMSVINILLGKLQGLMVLWESMIAFVSFHQQYHNNSLDNLTNRQQNMIVYSSTCLLGVVVVVNNVQLLRSCYRQPGKMTT